MMAGGQKTTNRLRTTDCMYDLYNRNIIEMPMVANKQNYKIEQNFISDADIFYCQGCTDPIFLEMVYEVRRMNPKIKIVVDLDDNLFELDQSNPVYITFCPDEIIVINNKKIKNPFFERNRVNLGVLNTLIMEADALVVTNEILACTLAKKNPNIFIRTNHLIKKSWDFPHIPIRNDGKIKIQWHGGNTHFCDWAEYNDAVVSVIQKQKNTMLELMIMPEGYESYINQYPKNRIRTFEFLDYDAHPYRLNCLKPDIAVLPLKETPFNVCKSDLKFTEYAILGTPCVAANISPYKDSIQHGVTGFLAKDKKEMSKYLTLLVLDSALRKKMGAAARDWALKNRTYDAIWETWHETLLEITKLPAWHQVKE